jgi:hypothetical protein
VLSKIIVATREQRDNLNFKDMTVSPLNEIEIYPIAGQMQEAQAGYEEERHPGDQPELAQGEVPEDDRVSDDEEWSAADWEEYDPIESARLTQRTIVQFSRQHHKLTPEQYEARRKRQTARLAESRARAAQMKAWTEAARKVRPETTTSPRPRTTRTRRPSTRANAPTTSPEPPEPEPAPLPAAALGKTTSRTTRSTRAVSDRPLDPRLRPFASALADLLLADLLTYPPEES